jgi:hypothetical protein
VSRRGVCGVPRSGTPEGDNRGVDAHRVVGYSKVMVPHYWPPPAALFECPPHKEFGLLELREISFDLPPEDLRRVARFLEHYAGEIESRAWRGGHVHIGSFDPSWRADQSGADVIVLNPNPEPPAVVQ